MKTIFASLLFLIGCLPVATFSQSPVAGKGDFHIDLDAGKFYGDESRSMIEIYYSVRTSMLAHTEQGGAYTGGASIRLQVWKDSSMLSTKTISVPFSFTDTAKLASGQMLVGIEQIALVPGEYRLRVRGWDQLDSTRIDTFTMPLHVASFAGDKEMFSDIELASSVAQSSDTTSIFYKNTLAVVPNASMLYGPGLPFVYYYYEVYNLQKPAMQTGVSIRTTITDGRMKEMYSADKNKQRLNNSSVEVGKVNITAYSSGSYTLQVKLTDSAGTEYASASKKFYIYKPGSIDSSSYVGGSSQDYATSEYAILTEKELDQEYQYARYIVLEPDRVQYEHLKDVNAKRKFLFEFWQKQTARTGMGATEYKQIYIKRVEYANEHFTKAFRQGWKTDRGRVYIMYGPYDDIEQFPSSSESNPYEIWHYNAIQGGVIFVFVDQNNIGQYTLVNSTHRDEIRNDNWYQQYAAKTN